MAHVQQLQQGVAQQAFVVALVQPVVQVAVV